MGKKIRYNSLPADVDYNARSKAASLLRKEKRKQKRRFIITNIPETEGQKRETARHEHLTINTSTTVHSAINTIIFMTWMKYAPLPLMDVLQSSTELLLTKISPKLTKKGGGKVYAFHFGWWRNFGDDLYEISDCFENEDAHIWISTNQPLWDLFNVLLQQDLPALHKSLMALPIPADKRYFGAIPLVILNVNNEIPPHHDGRDKREGLCFSMPFGNWRGGLLQLHDLNMSVNARPGDICGFQSFNLLHSVSAYTGVRYSVILTSHDDMYFPPCPNRKGKNNKRKNGKGKNRQNK